MIYFHSDYGQGAHPKVLDAICSTNLEYTDGYGLDPHCERAASIIKDLIGISDCEVHFFIGGTPCNVTLISAALRPYEAVIAARTGHAYVHETGGVEATGHRVVTEDGVNGKLTPELIAKAYTEYQDEHTVIPRLVYLSQSSEIGTIYSKTELTAIRQKCDELGLLLYVDGARLGAALTCKANDLNIRELAALCDAFYIGGTKNGALFGEALVVKNPSVNDHFRWMMKRQAGILAKGRLLGVQFEALLEGGENSLYYEIASHANKLAEKLRSGLSALGVEFLGNSPTNQVFPIFPESVAAKLHEDFFFYDWAAAENGMQPVRLVTSWGTKEEEVDAFLAASKTFLS
ncbi:MAG: threonine aldolase [Clostridia bacterium]|nr:threonine aldolase [Clostridia bacterium]